MAIIPRHATSPLPYFSVVILAPVIRHQKPVIPVMWSLRAGPMPQEREPITRVYAPHAAGCRGRTSGQGIRGRSCPLSKKPFLLSAIRASHSAYPHLFHGTAYMDAPAILAPPKNKKNKWRGLRPLPPPGPMAMSPNYDPWTFLNVISIWCVLWCSLRCDAYMWVWLHVTYTDLVVRFYGYGHVSWSESQTTYIKGSAPTVSCRNTETYLDYSLSLINKGTCIGVGLRARGGEGLQPTRLGQSHYFSGKG